MTTSQLSVVVRPDADAALDKHTGLQAGAGVDVHAVPVLELLAVLIGKRDEILRRQAEFGRVEVVQPADGVAAAAWAVADPTAP